MCDKATDAHFDEIKEILKQQSVQIRENGKVTQGLKVDMAVVKTHLEKNENDHEELKPIISDYNDRLNKEEEFTSNVKTGIKIVLCLLTFGFINFTGAK